MMKLLTSVFALFLAFHLATFGQTTSNIEQATSIRSDGSAPDASAMLDVQSTDKGMLIPRMTSVQRTSIASPATGLLVFDSTFGTFWFYDGSDWVEIKRTVYAAGTGISIFGATISNTGDVNPGDDITTGTMAGGDLTGFFPVLQLDENTVGTLHIINGSVNASDLANDAVTSAKIQNGAVANADLANNAVSSAKVQDGTITIADLSFGPAAAGEVLTATSPTTADWADLPAPSVLADADDDTKIQVEKTSDEDAIRFDLAGNERMKLVQNTNGHARLELGSDYNVVVGTSAFQTNTTGHHNTALGSSTLTLNTEGYYNTAIGAFALYGNKTGISNVAIGGNTLGNNSGGGNNIAIGHDALYWNSTGEYNIASGIQALFYNTTGTYNIAIGDRALFSNKANSRSTAIGKGAMCNADNTTTGSDTYNTALGYEALRGGVTSSFNTGMSNTAVGDQALRLNTSGSSNVALGRDALVNNTTGSYNSAFGESALYNNRARSHSTAIGGRAMYYANNSTAPGNTYNTAVGYEALRGSSSPAANTGSSNTAVGYQALLENTSGNYNAALGRDALGNNTTGSYNSAFGRGALYNNTTNNSSTAVGYQAMYYADNNTSGVTTYNTAIGYQALRGSTSASANTGTSNTALGTASLWSNTSGDNNTAVGRAALGYNVEGSYNTAIGYAADVATGNLQNATAIGARAEVNASNSMVLGSIDGVNGASENTKVGIGTTTPDEALDVNGIIKIGSYERLEDIGLNLLSVNSNFVPQPTELWSLGTSDNMWKEVWAVDGSINTSDRRNKTNIRDLDYGLQDVMKLRPVRYQWKNDPAGAEKLGLIAQELLEIIPEVVKTHDWVRTAESPDAPGQLVELDRFGVYYDDIIPVLVKAIQEQQAVIRNLNDENTVLKSALEDNTTRLEKITTALEGAGIIVEK